MIVTSAYKTELKISDGQIEGYKQHIMETTPLSYIATPKKLREQSRFWPPTMRGYIAGISDMNLMRMLASLAEHRRCLTSFRQSRTLLQQGCRGFLTRWFQTEAQQEALVFRALSLAG